MLLDGIRVLSFTHFLQGPSAVQLLADMGADVLKIEPPQGAWERTWSGANTFLNGVSVFFMLANRNQRSVCLNLKTVGGRLIVDRLIRQADVLVENYRPGVMPRLGLGYDAVKLVNPALVYCSCSGYGPDGPYRDLPGQDLLVQAMSGLAAITGQGDEPPTAVGTAIVDQHSAALAAVGILGCLVERARTGLGRRVDVSLLSAALDLQLEPLSYFLNGGRLAERSTAPLADPFHAAPYGIYQTQDGWLAISHCTIAELIDGTEADELRVFLTQDQFEVREELSHTLGTVIARLTTREWVPRLRAAGVWCSEVRGYDAVASDEQVEWNGSFADFRHPAAGRVRYLTHPLRYDDCAPELRRTPPSLGEHTSEVLRDLGFDDDEIARFEREGAIVTSQRA